MKNGTGLPQGNAKEQKDKWGFFDRIYRMYRILKTEQEGQGEINRREHKDHRTEGNNGTIATD